PRSAGGTCVRPDGLVDPLAHLGLEPLAREPRGVRPQVLYVKRGTEHPVNRLPQVLRVGLAEQRAGLPVEHGSGRAPPRVGAPRRTAAPSPPSPPRLAGHRAPWQSPSAGPAPRARPTARRSSPPARSRARHPARRRPPASPPPALPPRRCRSPLPRAAGTPSP